MSRNRKLIIIGAVILIVLLGAVYTLNPANQNDESAGETPALQTAVARRGDLVIFASAAGQVIPSSEVSVGFSESGTLIELLISVGEDVQVGQVLARMQTDISAETIAADLTSAQLNQLTGQQDLAALYSEHQMDQALALVAAEEAELALEDLKNPELAQAQAYAAFLTAQDQVEDAEKDLARTQVTASQAEIDAAYAQVLLAGQALDRARDQYEPLANKPDDNLQKANAQANLSAAQNSYDAAVRNHNSLNNTASQTEVVLAEAELAEAQAELAAAERTWDRAQLGPSAGEVALAEAELAAAQATVSQLEEGPNPDDLAVAEAKLANSEAQLALAEQAQPVIELVASTAGTISQITPSVGQSISTSAIITIVQLDQPLLEIFLDETDLDKISLGIDAEVVFDAFPDETFSGIVIEISPELQTISGVSAVRAVVQLTDYAKHQVLPIGLNAGVDVIGGRALDSVLVPVEALREIGPGEYAVFVVENDEPLMRVVEIGLIDFTTAEILSGLEAGEIVTTGIVDTQ